MSRITRASLRTRSASASTSGTPQTNVSPLFSTKTSVKSEQPTPDTTDMDDDDAPPTKRPIRISSIGTVLKIQDAPSTKRSIKDEDVDSKPALRRRVTGREVYVEVPRLSRSNSLMSKDNAPSTPTRKVAIGRPVKQLPRQKKEEGSDEEQLVSEDELEYKEFSAGEDDDEFADSGSEFQMSEDDDEDFAPKPRKSPRKSIPMDVDSDDVDDGMEDDEEALLGAAIAESLRTAQLQDAVHAGKSSAGAGPSTSSPSALRAAAAERRRTLSSHVVDDNAILESDASALTTDDEDVPLANLKKGKGKGKPKPKTKLVPDKKTSMTMAEMKKQRREEQAARRRSNRENATEERALRKKLGRKLTYAEKSTLALHKHHAELRDVWGDLEANIDIVVPQRAPQPDNLKVTLLPFQQESLFWMRKQEQGVWSGGMLADEMGMGKTIQTIALMVSDTGVSNLVLAPTVAVMQWKSEIETHSPHMKVLVWYGASRATDTKELLKYDVVLTTYAVLESSFRKQQSGFKRKGKIVKEKSPLHQVNWHRIILDEAHNIKERQTNTAKACFELKSSYKWCLSGTPLQNRVGELYSLVRFLGGDPFSYYFCKKCDCKSLHWKFSDKRTCDDCHHSPMQHTCFWNNEILTPIQKNGMVGPGRAAFKKLRILLDRMMLRRTKIERADDLGLPPRTVIVRRDYFSPEEKELYMSLFSDAKRQFSTYVDQGTLLNNYSNIFSLITRMRQMACHPDLVLRSKRNALVAEAENEATVCRLCNDIAEDAIQAKCRHIFDRECIKQYLLASPDDKPECPVCRLPLSIDLEAPALEIQESVAAVRQGILGRLDIDSWRSSSKIEALVEELTMLRQKDATTKSLVFSQFVNFLDLIAFRLQRLGFNICRLEGSMSPQARAAIIKHFMDNPHVTVFLVSLKAGGVALNLTEASRVYLMDSWWNPAVEFQAMDRIHRLGQHRPVEAIKLVVEDSIESRIVQLQEKKSAMVDATLSTNDEAMGKLTPEDLGFLFRL